MRYLVCLAFAAISLCASAQQADTAKELVSSWIVTVEGESRLRVLNVAGYAPKAPGTYLLEASYGFLDARQTPATAEYVDAAGQKTLKITTGGNGVITATRSADGRFEGTFQTSRSTKRVTLAKIGEDELKLKVRAAVEEKEQAGYADEGKDWGVAAVTSQRRSEFHAPTPTGIPGAQVIKTSALKKLLDADKSVVVVDVLDGVTRSTIPGARWMPEAGNGLVYPAEKARFAEAIAKFTSSDKSRPIVFMCLSAQCWLSYNASLLAVEAGYTNVMWYRGGVEAWRAAGLPVERAERANW
jgi:PQQ-dependent catabolism-associated CXXCW motif protein